MFQTKRTDRLLGLVIIAVLIVGCLAVLAPFVTALLLAVILAYATWPLNMSLRRKLRGSNTAAAALMTLGASLILVAPLVIVALSLADNAAELVEALRGVFQGGLPDLPHWMTSLPGIGPWLDEYWKSVAHDSSRLYRELDALIPPARTAFLTAGGALIGGVVQLALAVMVAFFLYRNGEIAADKIARAVVRVGGARGKHLLEVTGHTVIGVVYGVLGTALAQGTLAAIGFLLAGVPGALLLGLATFFMSVTPVGPPLIWAPAAIWLFYQGSTGWAIFVVLWGMLFIGLIDNFLKPMLISRGSSLPFILVFLGVLGGVVAFGFIGVFLGPTLLAVGYRVVNEWVDGKMNADESKGP